MDHAVLVAEDAMPRGASSLCGRPAVLALSSLRRRGSEAHSPMISSPLNPATATATATTTVLRATAAPAPAGSGARQRNTKLLRRNLAMSPAQRLLRQKAAMAWRSQALSRNIAWYERRADVEMKPFKVATLRSERPRREDAARPKLSALRYAPVDGKRGTSHRREQASLSELREKKRAQKRQLDALKASVAEDDGNGQYMFHMPDLGFFTPRRVVVAVGMKRMLPSLRQNLAPCVGAR